MSLSRVIRALGVARGATAEEEAGYEHVPHPLAQEEEEEQGSSSSSGVVFSPSLPIHDEDDEEDDDDDDGMDMERGSGGVGGRRGNGSGGFGVLGKSVCRCCFNGTLFRIIVIALLCATLLSLLMVLLKMNDSSNARPSEGPPTLQQPFPLPEQQQPSPVFALPDFSALNSTDGNELPPGVLRSYPPSLSRWALHFLALQKRFEPICNLGSNNRVMNRIDGFYTGQRPHAPKPFIRRRISPKAPGLSLRVDLTVIVFFFLFFCARVCGSRPSQMHPTKCVVGL
jgi:hypothetical protein